MVVAAGRSEARLTEGYARERADLAAAFRLAVEFDWHESVGNHFSFAVSDDGTRFLMNPRWVHFSLVRASDLLLLDARDMNTMARENPPDATAWCIHGAIHASNPRARAVLHCHPPYATALAGLQDPALKPIDQVTARFFNRMAVDLGFGGLADEAEEGRRIAAALGEHSVMMMGNHGVTAVGATVGAAFEELYLFERACRTMMLAYASGQPLNLMSDELAEKTAADWDGYRGMAAAHFEQLRLLLDRKDPSYRD